MKIVCIEPLGISEDKVDELAKSLRENGDEFVYYSTRVCESEALIERGKDADIIIIANLPLKGEVIEKCTNLKMISVAFTGVDHIDMDMCKAKNIMVCNAAGYSTNAVTELTFGLIFSVMRNIIQCDEAARNEKTKDGLVGNEIAGMTFGIVGTGAIGSMVADVALAFGCKVIAYSRTIKAEIEKKGIKYVSLEELMTESDIVSLHLPCNDNTKGLISEDKLSLMKKSAIFINTARGPIVDNTALARFLNEGLISGAGIDVFETEPPISNSHPLVNAKNTVLTPHVAFASKEALVKRAIITFNNITEWEKGTPINVIK